MKQGKEYTVTRWTQIYFTDFLSDIGGLYTSLMAGATFIMSGYQNFVAQKSMLKRLYGEEDLNTYSKRISEFESPCDSSAKEILRAKIEKKKDFNASYCLFILVSCFKKLCCCSASCTKYRCKRHLDSHRKF